MSTRNFAAATKTAAKMFTAAAAVVATPVAIVGGVTALAYDPPHAPQEKTDAAVNDMLRTYKDPAYMTYSGHKIEGVGKISVSSVDQDGDRLCANYATLAFRPTLDDPFSDFNKQLANKKRTCITRDPDTYPAL